MNEKTKQHEPDEISPSTVEQKDAENADNWSRDQREKSYYYDDSYGYEIYNPDEDEDEDDSFNTPENAISEKNPTKL